MSGKKAGRPKKTIQDIGSDMTDNAKEAERLQGVKESQDKRHTELNNLEKALIGKQDQLDIDREEFRKEVESGKTQSNKSCDAVSLKESIEILKSSTECLLDHKDLEFEGEDPHHPLNIAKNTLKTTINTMNVVLGYLD